MATAMTLTTQGVRNLNDLGPKKKTRKSEAAELAAESPSEEPARSPEPDAEAPAPIVAG